MPSVDDLLRPVVEPDVYGSSPFEQLMTANPNRSVEVSSGYVFKASSWTSKEGLSVRIPAMPQWPADDLSVGPFSK